MSHELKRHGYWKWYNSFSHATNDCNVFHTQIQLAINEGRLVLYHMQIDQNSFPVHTVELQNPKVLFWPNQAESTKRKNIIFDEKDLLYVVEAPGEKLTPLTSCYA